MLFSLLISLILAPSYSWDISDYGQYNSEQFFARSDVNTSIDLNKLNRSLLDAAVFYASNEARNRRKKETLSFNIHLQKAAIQHSDDMEREDFISHQNPREAKSRTPMMRIENAGGDFKATAENIARVNLYQLGPGMEYFVDKNGRKLDSKGHPLKLHTYASLARMVVEGWMNSKGHRENLLGDYDFLGCGVSKLTWSGQQMPEILITQNFGTKKLP